MHQWLLGVITVLVYLSALPGDFVWTERVDILQGGHRLTEVQDLGDALTSTRAQYRLRDDGGAPELEGQGTWQPLIVLANSLSWSIWGKCSLCWHLESLAWHLLAIISLYLVGQHLFVRHRFPATKAFWAAALFAVHPAGVESVAWIGARGELIASALAAASLAVFIRLPATTNSQRDRTERWLTGSAVLGGLAMLAHESAYLLPLLALLISGVAANQRGRDFLGGIPPLRWRAMGMLTGVLCVLLIYRYFVLGGLHFAGSYPGDGLMANAGTMMRHLWGLIDRTLLPHEPVISDAWPITWSWGAGTVAALIGTLLLIGATLAGLAMRQLPAFGSAWFLLWIATGVGVFPSEFYHSDQTLYMALWGASFALVYGIGFVWQPIGRQMPPGSEAALFVPILAVMIVITTFSNVRWWDRSNLFNGEIASAPMFLEGRMQLAEIALQEARPEDALTQLQAALDHREKKRHTGYFDDVRANQLAGQAHMRLGDHDQAITALQAAAEARPSSLRTWQMLARAQMGQGDYRAADSSLARARQLGADSPSLLADQALVTIQEGDAAQGIGQLSDLLGAHPEIGAHHLHAGLGRALLDQAQYSLAREQLQSALEYADSAETRAALALAAWRLNDRDTAYEQLSLAIRGMPEEGPSEFIKQVETELMPVRDYGP